MYVYIYIYGSVRLLINKKRALENGYENGYENGSMKMGIKTNMKMGMKMGAIIISYT